ncbi:MAG: hypothetical protein NUV72_08895 [Bauldia sp.]|nr:hypothetical protein [Bauldia sp.]
MSPARKAFVWVFGIALAIGVIVGVAELIAPDSVSVTLNDQDVTGVAGFVTASVIGGGVGLVLGLVIGGIVKLATRGSGKAA